MKKIFDYYLGLDIGTNSVGWAMTDLEYKLIRINGKNMWGVRLFEEASTAEQRRLSRESRRRLERRKWRIQLLQEIFAPTINAVDPNFFARLDDSNLYDGDKREKTIFSLFNDADFTDKDFHKKYRTIYHLRQSLLTAENPDPRLVYLALHHIIKYRGHFLLDWDVEGTADIVQDIETPLNAINAYLEEREHSTFPMKVNEFRAALIKKCNRTDKAKAYVECFEVKGNKPLCTILELIAGKTVKVKNLPVQCSNDELSVCFGDDWESKSDEIRSNLQDDYILLENAKILYDYSKLKEILGDHRYISQGMVEKYEKHRNDLAKLKRVLKKYFPKQTYLDMFRDARNEKATNYTAYSGKINFGAKKNGKRAENLVVAPKSRTYEDFTKYVKKVLESNADAMEDVEVKEIFADIDRGNFMPKQVSKDNATLPYQVNLDELIAILDNVGQYPQYKFLYDVQDGVTVYDKIKSLLTFRIPYYVGPINNHSGKYWCVKTSDERILPWNLEQKVDLQESEKGFIERMTKYCPYCPDQKVLPKCSLLYEEFVFLNQIGNIKVDGEPLSPQNKTKLSHYFATSGKNNLTKKVLKEWLLQENVISATDDVLLEGIDDEGRTNRRNYYNFVHIFGGVEEVENHRREIEEIINYSTIAGKEKQNLRRKIQRDYPFISESQLKQIVGLSMSGWGRCSQAFLTQRVGTNPQTGEVKTYSVIDAMRNQSGNFMEIYNSEIYGFKQAVESKRTQVSGDITYDMVDSLYCSPSVKKQIWQALLIVKEIKKMAGSAPKKIFVEVARGIDPQEQRRDENNRNKSRQQQVAAALEALKKENAALYSEVFETFSKEEQRKFNNKKLYLYYLQNGRDIYTGDKIDYNNLEMYDIDHICPRSKIKDDSLLNNLVLTSHQNNVIKADKYPVSDTVQSNMSAFWATLKRCGFINEEKYRRLTRKAPLTEAEIADFINRQLVETQQSTKEVIGLLKQIFPKPTEIVWSKAGNVTDFRKGENGSSNGCIKFIKSRDINDLHHAKDAYLNIVVGNTYNVRYGHNARVYFSQNLEKATSTQKLFEKDVKNNSCTAWIAGSDGTISRVIKTMQSNSVLFTKESYVGHGQLFNATIYKKGTAAVPLKGKSSKNRKFALMSDKEKYGGYDSESRVYYMLVRFTETKATKKKTEKIVKYTFLGVTAKDSAKLTNDETRIKYCLDAGLDNPVILIPQIKILSMFEKDGTMLMLSGMTGKQLIWRLAQQYHAEQKYEEYMKKVSEVAEKYNKASRFNEIYTVNPFDRVSTEQNSELYNVFVESLSSQRYQGASSIVAFVKTLQKDAVIENFQKLTVAQQCVVLSQIVKGLQCNASTSNLQLLGEGANCGKIRTPAVLDSLEGWSIVHRSITGVFEQKIPLSSFDKV